MNSWIIIAAGCMVVVSPLIFIAGIALYGGSSPSLEYNWWVDHQELHYPGVFVSPAFENTTCRDPGNIPPVHGENITRIQWLGGLDAVFVGNFKIDYDDKSVIVPTPGVGGCIHLYNVTGNVTVYGQDSPSGGWIKLGSGNISSMRSSNNL